MTAKRTAKKWLIFIFLILVLVIGFFMLTNFDPVGIYGGIFDGKFVYVSINSNGTIETNWLDRNATASYEIEHDFSDRFSFLQKGKSFADISFSDFSSGYRGYATGYFRKNTYGQIELVLSDGRLTKNIDSAAAYYYEQGERMAKSDEIAALENYKKAEGYRDSGKKAQELAEKIFDGLQNTSSYRYTDGNAFSDLLLIYDYVDSKSIDPLMKIAYEHWLNNITELSYMEDGKYHDVSKKPILGYYEQDGNVDNGAEPIEWEYLSYLNNNSPIMLKATNSLDYLPFDEHGRNTSWQESTLYHWLTNDFLNTAFLPAEAKIISEVTILSEEVWHERQSNYEQFDSSSEYYLSTGRLYDYHLRYTTISDYVIQKRGKPRSKYILETANYWYQEDFSTEDVTAPRDVVPVIILKPEWPVDD